MAITGNLISAMARHVATSGYEPPINHAPTEVSLSAAAISENNAINDIVGALSTTDPDAGNTFVYTLVSGTGSTDNASFNISGANLRAGIAFDYETKSSYSIRVRATDQGGLYFEKAFAITITDVVENSAPTNISLSAAAISENNAINDIVGALSTTDPDAGNTFVYTLVSGTGSTDNASFNISEANLRAGIAFDYETKSSYSIRVRATDQGGLFFEKVFAITITDVFEPESEYSTVLAAMAAQPSAVDKTRQNEIIKSLKNLGVWSKIILLDVLCAHDEQSSLLNWKAPGTTNPSKYNSPAFTAYKGFKGATTGSHMIRTNFTPSVSGSGFLGQDDITVIAGVQEDVSESIATFGSNGTTPGLSLTVNFNGFCYARANQGSNSTFYAIQSNRWWGISRNTGASSALWKNKVKGVSNIASTGLANTEMWLSGRASSGASNTTGSIFMVSKSLTDNEYTAVIDIFDSYLKSYNNHIRKFQTAIGLNTVIEGHSFMIASRVEDAIVANVNAISWGNLSTSGAYIADLVTRASTVDAKLIAETATYKNILALWIGLNDVTNTVGSGTTAYNAMKSYIGVRAASGWKVFAYTMTPTTSGGRSAQFGIERNTFNGLMRSDLALLQNVYVLDTDTISQFNDPANITYYSDALHPTWNGAKLAGALFSSRVEQLYA